MAALGVTAPQVNAALTAFSSDDPGGRASIGMVEQNIRVLGSSKSVDAIRNLTIPIEGSYVRLSDIAEVGDGQSEIRGFARLNGRLITAVQKIGRATSELQSLMRTSYAVFCLKKKK